MEITKEQFNEFTEVQDFGEVNMLSPQAREMTELSKQEWIFIMNNYEDLENKYNNKREIAVNQIVMQTCYIRNEDGSITYDFEMMAEEFENELAKLDKSVNIGVALAIEDKYREHLI